MKKTERQVHHERLARGGTIPGHIAIIMDGNGRWAKRQYRSRIFGHRAGTRALKRIVRACGEMDVRYLTAYTFSSENWQRPLEEVKALMLLLVEMVRKEVRELNKNNVKLKALGNLTLLPKSTREVLEEGIAETAGNTGLQLNLALSYGGRDEILEACRKISRKVAAGALKDTDIDEQLFREHLFQPGVPDPELLIRTGGDMRVSNYLLWQIAYTEFWVTDTLWPDFSEEHLYQALTDFQRRERRFGMTSDQVRN